MEYMDEKILKMKNQFKKYENKDIMGTVHIGEEKFEFEDVEFFDGKMTMRIPEVFTDMPLEMAKMKYPSEQRPQSIKTNEDGSVNITLSLFDEAIEKDQIKECRNGFRSIIKRMNPSTLFFDNEIMDMEDTKIGYFDYRSPALDDNLYNIMFVRAIDSKLLMGTFNCIFKDMEEWKPVALQMILSIKDLTQKKEGETA
ncbi:hypothetical protein SAMN05446037_100514 [Anaerovirgula multivorans]|uniref:DUF1795 domain-containing protein n=1 Tax=Anaerovirgula multivorans TaxID=312168 RepID=A0A239C787_9FIRM|nr:hypothetical protein [Anaerovirgula multivorans]SNS15304.1 hypothetical protein SAMN05446037_100514 [Anaerovirgula multivorans]